MNDANYQKRLTIKGYDTDLNTIASYEREREKSRPTYFHSKVPTSHGQIKG